MPNYLQLRCPKCGEEFAFPRGKLEEERAQLVRIVQEAKEHLQEIKGLPKSSFSSYTWSEKNRWSKIYERATTRLSEIKNLLKQASEPTTSDMFHLYRERIKDMYGDAVDESALQWAKENLEAYRVSDLSAHNFYTSASGKVVKKV